MMSQDNGYDERDSDDWRIKHGTDPDISRNAGDDGLGELLATVLWVSGVLVWRGLRLLRRYLQRPPDHSLNRHPHSAHQRGDAGEPEHR